MNQQLRYTQWEIKIPPLKRRIGEAFASATAVAAILYGTCTNQSGPRYQEAFATLSPEQLWATISPEQMQDVLKEKLVLVVNSDGTVEIRSGKSGTILPTTIRSDKDGTTTEISYLHLYPQNEGENTVRINLLDQPWFQNKEIRENLIRFFQNPDTAKEFFTHPIDDFKTFDWIVSIFSKHDYFDTDILSTHHTTRDKFEQYVLDAEVPVPSDCTDLIPEICKNAKWHIEPSIKIRYLIQQGIRDGKIKDPKDMEGSIEYLADNYPWALRESVLLFALNHTTNQAGKWLGAGFNAWYRTKCYEDVNNNCKNVQIENKPIISSPLPQTIADRKDVFTKDWDALVQMITNSWWIELPNPKKINNINWSVWVSPNAQAIIKGLGITNRDPYSAKNATIYNNQTLAIRDEIYTLWSELWKLYYSALIKYRYENTPHKPTGFGEKQYQELQKILDKNPSIKFAFFHDAPQTKEWGYPDLKNLSPEKLAQGIWSAAAFTDYATKHNPWVLLTKSSTEKNEDVPGGKRDVLNTTWSTATTISNWVLDSVRLATSR